VVYGENWIILGAFDREAKLHEDPREFQKALHDELLKTKNDFRRLLNQYQLFTELAQENTFDFVSFNQFVQYLLREVQISVRRNPDSAPGGLVYADGIFVYPRLIQKGPSSSFVGLRETLERRLRERAALLRLPLYFSEKPSPRGIPIYANAFKDQPNRLDIVLGNHMVIELKFSPKYDDAPSSIENESLADFVVGLLQSLLGVNAVHLSSKMPDPISKWASVPSLLFAGTSQLIIADRFQPAASIKSQKRWGRLFLTAEVVLLGAAFAFDQQAVRNVDNSALQTRNRLLISAGILGSVSALKAWFNIRGHNKMVKSRPQ
jgi:hypothetical protein